MEKVTITIIGAGVIGLAIAQELSRYHQDIFVIEKSARFGQETSSRNSEVIHSGIYYPAGSLKASLCVEGRRLLYEFCSTHALACKMIGKLIVACNEQEIQELHALCAQGLANGVQGLRILSRQEIKEMEPQVNAIAALYAPSTGIIDSHGFMQILESQCKDRRCQIAYATELTAADKVIDGYALTVKDKGGGEFKFLTRVLINCAGLHSDKVARMVGIRRPEHTLWYSKGDYFRVQPKKASLINRLIYPVPKKEGSGLGIHATLDLAGGLRLGPDDEYVKDIEYRVDPKKQKTFYESVCSFLPFIEYSDLNPDMAGIRPKLQGPGEAFRDFLIQEESRNGFPGLINLIGIESPGLTASLAISRFVKSLLEQSLR